MTKMTPIASRPTFTHDAVRQLAQLTMMPDRKGPKNGAKMMAHAQIPILRACSEDLADQQPLEQLATKKELIMEKEHIMYHA